MSHRVRKRFVPAIAAVGVPATLYYASLGVDERAKLHAGALGAKRAARSVACAAELALRYKFLTWFYGGEDPSIFAARRKELHEFCAHRVLRLCRTNGGAFTKLGQHATTLKPAVPEEYVRVLSVLQDKAPTRPLAEVRAVMREELDLSSDDDLPFCEFQDEPVGSASLAQVHWARLRDGTEVAVKIQHHDIEKILSSDLRVVRWLEGLASRAFRDEGFSFAWAVDEFERNVALELDFLEEAANAERCRELFENHPILSTRVCVPAVHREFCTKRLLTMEFAHGVPIHALVDAVRESTRDSIVDHGTSASAPRIASTVADPELQRHRLLVENAPKVSRLLIEAYAAMIFTFGFVHCDPHPGNLLVVLPPTSTLASCQTSEVEPKLVLLDHGLYRELSDVFRRANCGLWKAMVAQDVEGVARHAAMMGIERRFALLLPIFFTNRAPDTRAGLGQPVTREQGASLKEAYIQAGVLSERSAGTTGNSDTSVSVSGVGTLADHLPTDMLFIMRAMHLVASLHKSLGGSNASRFEVYAWAAVNGEWETPVARGKGSGDGGCKWSPQFVATAFAKRLSGAMFLARLWFNEALIRYAAILIGRRADRAAKQEHFTLLNAVSDRAGSEAKPIK
eukprot:TRINITY_DN36504_c0_g1_i1.p1 TRINITY_DN36504_c0_g1~~TRINITY_DN36504_c0_g1_i1.p1  ORF type:complete len:642 (+),score=88.70 TRINITY_DN36504_c0_g1_i1:52-1926(+)